MTPSLKSTTMLVRIMAELEQDHLLENTIIFFWGDHGSGYPRGKTYLYEDGLHVPLIVRFPEKYKDLAPQLPSSEHKYTFDDRIVDPDGSGADNTQSGRNTYTGILPSGSFPRTISAGKTSWVRCRNPRPFRLSAMN